MCIQVQKIAAAVVGQLILSQACTQLSLLLPPRLLDAPVELVFVQLIYHPILAEVLHMYKQQESACEDV